MRKKSKKFKMNFKNKNTSIIIIIISCFLLTLILLGIYKSNSFKVISKDSFIQIMEKNNLDIYDVTNQFGEDYVESATIAHNKKTNYQIEFVVFSDDDYAKNAFKINKNTFESNKNENSKELSLSNEKISYYALSTDDKYMYVSRRKNTLIYLSVDGSVKTETENLITKLGY